MSLDQELRAVLTEQAERFEASPPDFDAMMAGGLVLRRRRRVVVAVSAFVVLAILAAGRSLWDTRADEPVDWPKPQLVTSTQVPWCVTDPDHPDGKQLIVGAGPPVRTWCTYHGDPGHSGWLWHHAGSTILVRGGDEVDGVFRVADGRLTRLGTAASASRVVKMSHDGRYVAWTDGSDGCQLNVYEVATAAELASATTPTTPPGGYVQCDVDGIDDLGRVYVAVDDDAFLRVRGASDVRPADRRVDPGRRNPRH